MLDLGLAKNRYLNIVVIRLLCSKDHITDLKNKEGCVFILPRKNPLKAVYIKQIIKIYDDKE